MKQETKKYKTQSDIYLKMTSSHKDITKLTEANPILNKLLNQE